MTSKDYKECAHGKNAMGQKKARIEYRPWEASQGKYIQEMGKPVFRVPLALLISIIIIYFVIISLIVIFKGCF